MADVVFSDLEGRRIAISRHDADELLRKIDRRLVTSSCKANLPLYRALERIRVELSIALARALETV